MKNFLSGIVDTRGSRRLLPSLMMILTACSQDFGVALQKLDSSNLPQFCLLADGSVVPSVNGDCSSGPGGPPLQSKISTFDTASIQNKKIDVVMVIDDSGSMEEEQAKVKNGLQAVASQYLSHSNFVNNYLDVCVHVISSTYYKTSPSGQGFVGCTSNSSIDLPNLVSTAVNLGIGGSGQEALGKSLITYLTNKDTFTDAVNASSLNLTKRISKRCDSCTRDGHG